MNNSSLSTKDRIVGSLMGGAIGDALGYQCEFTRGIKEREYKTFKDDYGIFSDDTQMMLFTANALLWRNTYGTLNGEAPTPTECIRRAYCDWYQTQNETKTDATNISWIDKIEAMNHRRAPGFTCIEALSHDTQGTIKQPINQSKGCGSVMRVAPIGLVAHAIDDAVKVSAESAALTHGHPLAIIPAAFLGALYFEIVHDVKHNFTEQLHIAFEYANQFATKNFHKQYQDDFTKLMRKAFTLSRNSTHDIENIHENVEQMFSDKFLKIPLSVRNN